MHVMDSIYASKPDRNIDLSFVSLILHCYNLKSMVVFCFNVGHPIRLRIEFFIKIFQDQFICFRKMHGYHLGK